MKTKTDTALQSHVDASQTPSTCTPRKPLIESSASAVRIHRTGLSFVFERQSLVALNQQLFRQIIAAIERGELAPLAFLPGERELAEQYNIGRQVVRNAYHRLRVAEIAQSGRAIGWQITENARTIARRISADNSGAVPEQASASDVVPNGRSGA